MARFKIYFAFIFVFLVLGVQSAKLNVPRVLIPLFSSVQVNFTLEVSDGGCYKWSSSRDDVVSVKPLIGEGDCSRSARVSSATNSRTRNTAIILAEDVNSGQVLRCDVIVDNIVSLDVVTTTRELYVEEAPEAFEIRAYDDQGNEFTTLEGVEFQWTLVSPLKDNDVIRIMSFGESSYEATESLQILEGRGLRGHTALIEGVKTGSAKVIMRLPQKEYATVKSVEVTLRVVANLLLVPSEATVLLGDSVQFKIVQVREGRLIEVPQPSPQYSLQNDDSAIAHLQPKTGVATGTKKGVTRVWLRDAGEAHGGQDGETSRPPEARLRVGDAARLQLAPVPASVQEGFPCVIHVRMMDSENRPITIGPETRIAVTLDEDLFSVTWRSVNGSVVEGTALRPGKVGVTATLMSVAGKAFYPKITTTGEINIYQKISIIPPEVVLPWDPNTPKTPKAFFQMRAVGGDGSYLWRSEGAALNVGRFGMLTAVAPGSGTVTASVPSSPHISATAKVQVVEPSRMEIVWSEGEGPVGAGLALHVALYAARTKNSDPVLPFTKCDQMLFEVLPTEGVVFERIYPEIKPENEKLVGEACTILHVKCLESGTGRVTVRQGALLQEVSLACHTPLTRLFPRPQHAALLLTVGSSANVIFSGGPLSWAGGSDPRHQITVPDKETVSVAPYSSTPYATQQLHVYTVTCLRLGQTDVNLKIYRGETSTVLAEARLTVNCNNPHSMRISVRQAPDSLCPIFATSQVSLLSGGGSLNLEVTVSDMRGNVFHNASSLRIKWSSHPTSMLSDTPGEALLTQLDTDFSPVMVLDYHHQMLSISGVDLPESGVAEVIGEVYGYRNSILRAAGVRHTPPIAGSIKAVLSVKMVKPLNALGEKLVVYLAPGVEARAALFHGSGHLRLTTSRPELARVTLEGLLMRSLRVIPLQEGRLTVTAHDLCLDTPVATVEIIIVSAHGITSDLPPLLEQGQSVEVWVCLVDRQGVCLPRGTIGAPEITVAAGPGIKVTQEDRVPGSGAGAKCTVTGLEAGPARLDFWSESTRGSSATHVFLPLRVVPRVSLLLPGGSVGLQALGGPPHPASVRFALTDPRQDIIKIQPNGVVDAMLVGTAIVEARAEVGTVQYGSATASVRVRLLDGVAIAAPTAALLAGNTMPLWATGMPEGIGPLELGSLKPALHFSWSVAGDGEALISDVLGSTNVELDNTDRVSVRLTAIRSGRVTIHLNVSSAPGHVVGKSRTWSASMELVILQPLQLLSPVESSGPLLLAPHSSALLETNLPTNRLTYRISDDEGITRGALVSVSPLGLVTSQGRLGRAVLTISGGDPQQFVTIAVEVCPVHYAMMSVQGGAGLSSLAGLPAGLELRVTATHHDAHGRTLAGTAAKLRYHSTRQLVTHVKQNHNTSIELLLGEEGRSVFKVTDVSSDKLFADYVSFKVQNAILPQKVITTVGDVWCARSGVRGAVWGSSDPLALRVSKNGLVLVRAPRPAPSLLQLSAPGVSLQASAPVTTRLADRIYFLEPEVEHVFTDEKPYLIPLVLANSEEHDKITNLLSMCRDCMAEDLGALPFTCEAKQVGEAPLLHVVVEPVLDWDLGCYGCRITWSPSPSGGNSSFPRLEVVARTGPAVTPPLRARAVRAAILPALLHLSPPPALAATLDIMGTQEVLEQLRVTAVGDTISVNGPEQLMDSSYRYIVTGSRGAHKGHIRVLSPLTHQDVEVEVWYGSSEGGVCSSGGSSPLLSLLQDNLPLLLTVVTSLTSMMVAVWVYNSYIHPLLTPRPPLMQAQRPPLESSQIRNVSFSSRSPHSPPLGSPPSQMQPHATVYGDPSFMSSPDRRNNSCFR